MKTILDKIVDYKKEELASVRRRVSLKDVQSKADDAEPTRPFLGNFRKNEINIIAEVKKASPSKGIICEDFNPIKIAEQYQEAGAKALSILTDEHFFQGQLDYIAQIKKQVTLPCLRKDFTISDYHIFEARGAGADAILLIAAILEKAQLKDYQSLAMELDMSVLIEIHNEAEWEKISDLNPKLVGVNNRNLKDFTVDLNHSYELVKLMPKNITKISESGLQTHNDLVNLQSAGFDGFLIGETFLKEKNVGAALRKIREG